VKWQRRYDKMAAAKMECCRQQGESICAVQNMWIPVFASRGAARARLEVLGVETGPTLSILLSSDSTFLILRRPFYNAFLSLALSKARLF
jgi:hypothetical protein